jgi:hypothetical protein
VGAQASGTVHNFLVDHKIVEAKKRNVMPKRTKQVKKKKLRQNKNKNHFQNLKVIFVLTLLFSYY